MLLVHEQDVAPEQHTGGSQPSSSGGEDDDAEREESEQCRSEGGPEEHGSESGSGEEEDKQDAAGEEESDDEDEEQDDEEQGSEDALDSGSEKGEPAVSGAEGCTSPVLSSGARPAEEGSGEERSEAPSPSGTDEATPEPVPDSHRPHICICQTTDVYVTTHAQAFMAFPMMQHPLSMSSASPEGDWFQINPMWRVKCRWSQQRSTAQMWRSLKSARPMEETAPPNVLERPSVGRSWTWRCTAQLPPMHAGASI